MMRQKPSYWSAGPKPGTSATLSRRRGAVDKQGFPFALVVILLSVGFLGMGGMLIYGMTHLRSHRHHTNAYSSRLRNSPVTMAKKAEPQATQKPEYIAHIQAIKDQFESRYGGYSETLLKRGLKTFGSVDATAARMLQASQMGRPFVMAFSGYSVTVGRGNFFNQSFPFEVQRILKEPMEQILGIPLVVRNAAIGGIPSFPYGFCLEHFLGEDPDVISWDYSMNEGARDASVLEAFVRQSMQQLPKRPMMIMLDMNEKRTQLLKDYTAQGLLLDAIAVGRKDNVMDESTLAQLGEPVPPGFQEWNEFGAPKSCPGRGSWHPKRQEHAMMGWVIAMYFVQALERAAQMKQQGGNPGFILGGSKLLSANFPKPLSQIPNNDPEVTELLFGHETREDGPPVYAMKDVSCRTSFLPATDHDKELPSIVVSGWAEGDLDIMVDRTDEHYRAGWMMDVSKVERETKVKVERCGGLGYIDMKIALYGVPESGTLKLWLPFEGPSHEDHEHPESETDVAKHWFDDLIICEANEKRGDDACKLDKDMDLLVGGVPVTDIRPIQGAGEYLKRKTCVNVGVPSPAKITNLGKLKGAGGNALSDADKKRLVGGKDVDDETVGLEVEITAKPKVTREGGACCLSHIVWEMH